MKLIKNLRIINGLREKDAISKKRKEKGNNIYEKSIVLLSKPNSYNNFMKVSLKFS